MGQAPVVPPVPAATHKLEFSATVTDDRTGQEFYFESHRYNGLDDAMTGWIVSELDQFASRCEKLEEHEPHRDNEMLSAVFNLSVDGVARPPKTIKGGSYHELIVAERDWWEIGSRIIKFGEENAKKKGKPATPPGQKP